MLNMRMSPYSFASFERGSWRVRQPTRTVEAMPPTRVEEPVDADGEDDECDRMRLRPGNRRRRGERRRELP